MKRLCQDTAVHSVAAQIPNEYTNRLGAKYPPIYNSSDLIYPSYTSLITLP